MSKTSLISFDIIILIATLLLITIGILFIYSSGIDSVGRSISSEHTKQIIWAVTGILLMVLFLFLNFDTIKALSLPLYAGFLLLLVITLLFGKVVNGARSWIDFGIGGFQPSEFMKIVTILFLAFYLEQIKNKIRKLPYFLVSFGIIFLPMFLILIQPDFGTALVYYPIFIIMVYIAGGKVRHFLFITFFGFFLLLFISAPSIEKILTGEKFPVTAIFHDRDFVLILSSIFTFLIGLSIWGYLSSKLAFFYWTIYSLSIVTSAQLLAFLITLKSSAPIQKYQLMRLIAFINPNIDSKGVGWNIIQSRTAVGSGGVWGKGFLEGTQSHLHYLPQQSTDFIFSILAEEWGFMGGMLVLVLFFIILFRSIRILSGTKDRYTVLTGAGIVAMIFFHLVVNIGMAIGIMPITGIPLLLLSYGGSSLWTALIGIGIILNISFRRFK